MRVSMEVRVRVRVRRSGGRSPRVVQRRDAASVERAKHRMRAEKCRDKIETLARAVHDAPDAKSSESERIMQRACGKPIFYN